MLIADGMMKLLPTYTHIANDLHSKGWSYVDDFFESSLIDKLFQECRSLSSKNEMTKAKIGKKNGEILAPEIRGDYIKWIDNPNPNEVQAQYLASIFDLAKYLTEQVFIYLNAFESHFAVYPPGAGYQKHLDVFKQDDSRFISTVLYLNKGWQKIDGGQLKIYNEFDPDIVDCEIDPIFGRFVIFLSRNVYHEVCPAQKSRYSIAGWMKSVQLQKDPLAPIL